MEVRGKTVVLTGTFRSMKRDRAAEALSQRGAQVSSSLSSKTDILFVGENAGSKLAKARELGVAIHDEAALMALLGEPPSAPPLGEPPSAPSKVAPAATPAAAERPPGRGPQPCYSPSDLLNPDTEARMKALFGGKRVLLRGRFCSASQRRLVQMFEQVGADVSVTWGASPDVVILGEAAWTSAARALGEGIPIVSEGELARELDLLVGREVSLHVFDWLWFTKKSLTAGLQAAGATVVSFSYQGGFYAHGRSGALRRLLTTSFLRDYLAVPGDLLAPGRHRTRSSRLHDALVYTDGKLAGASAKAVKARVEEAGGRLKTQLGADQPDFYLRGEGGADLEPRYGTPVEIRTMKELDELVATPPADAEPTGEHADLRDRALDMIERLLIHPGVRVLDCRVMLPSPLDRDHVAGMEELRTALGGSIPPDLEALYQNLRSLSVRWVDVKSPRAGRLQAYDAERDRGLRSSDDGLETGSVYLAAPVTLARFKGRGIVFSDGASADDGRTVEIDGVHYPYDEFLRSLRMIDDYHFYHQAAIFIPPSGDRTYVVLGDDHGAAWGEFGYVPLKQYYDTVIDHFGSLDSRRDLFIERQPLAGVPPTLGDVLGRAAMTRKQSG